MRKGGAAELPGWCLALLILGTSAAGAADDLYQATAFVTGQGAEHRDSGFAKALGAVLVKVSGDPKLLADPRVAALGDKAADLVAEFHYHDRMSGIPHHDEQGSRDRPFDLTVTFDAEKIDAALRTLGDTPWSGARPRLVVFLAVRTGDVRYLLTSDEARGRDQRDSLTAAAAGFGMPMILPTAADLAAAGVTPDTLANADPASLAAAAKQAGGDMPVVGTLVWDESALGWAAEWRLTTGKEPHRWRIAGVNFDEAFRNGIGGAAGILSGQGGPD